MWSWAGPLEIPVWTAAMSFLFSDLLGLPFPAGVPGLGATVLSFGVAFLLTGVAVTLPRWSLRGGSKSMKDTIVTVEKVSPV